MCRAANPDASLILLHIPKTAGTTLAIILIGKYGQEATRAVTGGYAGREAFPNEPEAARASPRLFIGHQAFGLHEHIPRPCEYVTVLRDPVARIVSHYHHVLNEETHYLHKRVVDRGLTLEQYAENPFKSHELDNGQSRMLASYALNRSQRIGQSQRSLIPSAMENLERSFCCVVTTERFDETMVLLSDSLHWNRVPAYLPARVSQSKPREPIPQEIADKIREINALDVELYGWVSKRLDEHIRSLGQAFQNRVQDARAENARTSEQLRTQKAAKA